MIMDPNRLTQKSQEALHDAQARALRFGHTEVDGEHLLLALLDQADGIRSDDYGPESPDSEITGSAARRAGQGPALRAHRGRRRAPAAGPARSGRRHQI